MRTEDPRTKKALRQLVRHPTLALKALAVDIDVPYDTVHSWISTDGPVPTLAQVRALIWAAARYDAAAARELAAEVYGLGDAGWMLAAMPRPASGVDDLVGEVLQAGAAVGQVTGWAAEATVDHRVDSTEADEGWRLIQVAQRKLAEVTAQVERHRPPQLAWRLAGVAT
jgi:hypothetical protein